MLHTGPLKPLNATLLEFKSGQVTPSVDAAFILAVIQSQLCFPSNCSFCRLLCEQTSVTPRLPSGKSVQVSTVIPICEAVTSRTSKKPQHSLPERLGSHTCKQSASLNGLFCEPCTRSDSYLPRRSWLIKTIFSWHFRGLQAASHSRGENVFLLPFSAMWRKICIPQMSLKIETRSLA